MEYEVYGSRLGDMPIFTFIKALRKRAKGCTAEKRSRIHLFALLADHEKRFWEQNELGISIVDRSSHCNLQFTAHASVGMQEDSIRDIVSSRIQGTDFTLIDVREDTTEQPMFDTDGWHGWAIDLRMASRSVTTFAQLLKLRAGISEEVFLPNESLVSPFLVLKGLQAGRVDALLGRPETEYLEVKSAAYDLRNVGEAFWKLELAKDVAQFANAPTGGLLLIGYRTKRIDGVDVIYKMAPVQHKPNRFQTYGDVLKARIHPPISGLQIGGIPYGDNEVIYIYVPDQPEENKPYLISGAVIDNCYETNGISIVRRQGDASIPVTAQEIHAALVIGRAFIQGRRPTNLAVQRFLEVLRSGACFDSCRGNGTERYLG